MELIFTNHAKERLNLRKLHLSDIETTLAQPDRTLPQEDGLNYKFIKTISGRQYQVVAHLNSAEKKWIVVSAWVRGEEDPPDWLFLIVTFPFRALWWLIKNLALLLWRGLRALFGAKNKNPKHRDHHK